MPKRARLRYKLSAVIPRNDCREPLTQWSFVERHQDSEWLLKGSKRQVEGNIPC
jgi:hypothetical protein